jgi:hypothetical protein
MPPHVVYVETDSEAVVLEKSSSRGLGVDFQRLGLCQRRWWKLAIHARWTIPTAMGPG